VRTNNSIACFLLCSALACTGKDSDTSDTAPSVDADADADAEADAKAEAPAEAEAEGSPSVLQIVQDLADGPTAMG
jgi:hypothetical protein